MLLYPECYQPNISRPIRKEPGECNLPSDSCGMHPFILGPIHKGVNLICSRHLLETGPGNNERQQEQIVSFLNAGKSTLITRMAATPMATPINTTHDSHATCQAPCQALHVHYLQQLSEVGHIPHILQMRVREISILPKALAGDEHGIQAQDHSTAKPELLDHHKHRDTERMLLACPLSETKQTRNGFLQKNGRRVGDTLALYHFTLERKNKGDKLAVRSSALLCLILKRLIIHCRRFRWTWKGQ